MLRVIASERIEPLVADLARELADAPADPMTPEWIAVGSDGLARWLQLELAKHLGSSDNGGDGIAANIIMASPGTLRTAVVLAGTDDPDFDPWLVNRLGWSVLETLRLHGDEDEQLAPFVDESARSVYRRAHQIGSRFSAYQMYRPEMIRAWADGHDVDASGAPLSAAQSWQPHLWRLVRGHVGTPSPAERLLEGFEAVRSDPSSLRIKEQVLPPRLIFFGPSLLPTGAGFLDVAGAVAERRDVLVYVIEPSAPLSQTLRSRSREIIDHYDRSHDVSAEVAQHRLLRSWGRLQRETALLLAEQPLEIIPVDRPDQDRLLTVLQSQIHDNDAPTGAFEHSADDHSIEVHRCYGATRQVEALKDTLLHLVNDPTLELTEDDIVVACPSLDTFAPLITAHFGPSATTAATHSSDGIPLLRYRITGLAGGPDNPVTEGLTTVLRLATGRFGVDEVADFLAMPAVMNRFRWTEDHLERISGWLSDTNIRWGIDGDHRSDFDMPADISSYTWRTALDQLVLGTAVRSGSALTLGGTVPIDLAAGDVELVSQLAGVLAKLEELVILSRDRRTISQWHEILCDVMDRLLAPDHDSEWQSEATRRQLLRIVDSSRLGTPGNSHPDGESPDPSRTTITFREMVEMFGDVIAEQRRRSDFFRGGITITTLNALRNVPAKVICILGADQGAFSSGGVDSDDLIGTNPRLGDRDPRAEVRQTLLDAVLAARERLMLFSDGTDVRTNTDIPPAVVIAELLDAVDATCAPLPDPGPAINGRRRGPKTVSERITIDHPRQPFDESYFDDEAVPGRSFSRSSLDAAQQRRRRDVAAASNGDSIGPGDPDWTSVALDNPVVDTATQIDLDALRSVLRNSTRVFLHDGLGIRLPGDIDVRSAEVPLEGTGLDDWQLGTELLDVLSRGGDSGSWADRNLRLGNIPPLPLGQERLSQITSRATATIEAAEEQGVTIGPQPSVPIEIDLGDGRRLTGRVRTDPSTGTSDSGTTARVISSMSFSSAKDTDMLLAWVDLLALSAMDDSVPGEAIIINSPSRPTKNDPDPRPTIRRLRTDDLSSPIATETLGMLVQIYDTAIRRPVPLFPDIFDRDPDNAANPDNWASYTRPLSTERAFVYGDISVWQLMDLTAEGHPLIPDGAPLAQSYSDMVWEAFDRTVSVIARGSSETEDDL